MNQNLYTIGQLAKAIDVPSSTLRYYERRGLLRPPSRSGGNYRLYDEKTIARVRFIRSAQSTGFKLDDIQMLLSFEDGTSCPCSEVKEVLEKRLNEIDNQMKELRRLRKSLKASVAICEKSNAEDECGVLGNLIDDTRKGFVAKTGK